MVLCIYLCGFFALVILFYTPQWLGIVAVLALSSLVPGLCLISIQQKGARALASFRVALRKYHLDTTLYWEIFISDAAHRGTDGPEQQVERWAAENRSRAYLPITLIWLLAGAFSALIVYSGILLTPPARLADLLLLGREFHPAIGGGGTVDQAMLVQTLTTAAFAFLGWYAWSMSSIFSRMVSMELAPATYYTILIRLIVAVVVAIALERMLDIAPGAVAKLSPEAIGFAAGLFPETVLSAVTDWLRRAFLGKGEGLEELPLDVVQGISPFRKLRLHEMGLDNCQNLASANAIELFLMSNLKLVEVVDWIAQAQLAILVRADMFRKLQAQGYRHAVDFKRGCENPDVNKVLAVITGFQPAQLLDMAKGMETSPSFIRLLQLRRRIIIDDSVTLAQTVGAVPGQQLDG